MTLRNGVKRVVRDKWESYWPVLALSLIKVPFAADSAVARASAMR
jgi:hypothetical protein